MEDGTIIPWIYFFFYVDIKMFQSFNNISKNNIDMYIEIYYELQYTRISKHNSV